VMVVGTCCEIRVRGRETQGVYVDDIEIAMCGVGVCVCHIVASTILPNICYVDYSKLKT
jgi:hypothetical protein